MAGSSSSGSIISCCWSATLTPAGADTCEGRTLEDLVVVMDQVIDAPWVSEFRKRYLTPK
jgi:hypothetical protein